MQLKDYIDSDEHLLWQGKPPSRLPFRAKEIFLIPFSLLWFVFAIFWEMSAVRMGAPLLFLLVGGTFVIIGFYFVFGRFIFDAWRRSRTEYGLTNKRALILSGLGARELSSFPLSKNSEIRVSGKKIGRGSIKFGPGLGPTVFFRMGGFGIWQGPEHPFMFEGIEHVSNVYEQVRGIQNGSRI